VITVPAIGREDESHVAERKAGPDAQGAPKPSDSGGWVIAYALPK